MWFINKIYLLFILVCYDQIVFASLLLNKNNSQNRQTANAKKLTKAEERNPPISAHTLTSVLPSCFRVF